MTARRKEKSKEDGTHKEKKFREVLKRAVAEGSGTYMDLFYL